MPRSLTWAFVLPGCASTCAQVKVAARLIIALRSPDSARAMALPGGFRVVELPDHLSNRLQLDRLQRPTPNRTPALSGRSWAHSAIATYEQAPASTAATLTASTVTNR